MQYINVIFNFKIKYEHLCFFVWCVNFLWWFVVGMVEFLYFVGAFRGLFL